MANPELSQRIQELPEELLGLEHEPGIAERLRRIDALKDRARALDPLDGVEDMALADYDRDWLVRYTYNSNAIEGSTLTLEDTSLVLEGEFVPSDSPARYVFAARGVAESVRIIELGFAELAGELRSHVRDLVHIVVADGLPHASHHACQHEFLIVGQRFEPVGSSLHGRQDRGMAGDLLVVHGQFQTWLGGLVFRGDEAFDEALVLGELAERFEVVVGDVLRVGARIRGEFLLIQ